MPDLSALGTRWLGVGLSTIIAVVTLSLAITGDLDLYINPDSSWFAVLMAVVLLVGAVASFLLPLGAEADHGHDHGHAEPSPGPRRRGTGVEPAPIPAAEPAVASAPGDRPMSRAEMRAARDAAAAPAPAHDEAPAHTSTHAHHAPHPLALAATVAGGVIASGVVLLTLFLPPTSLSSQLALSRDVGVTPLFAGQDAVQLAASGDTSAFGIGEWSTVFATSTSPETFDGQEVTLTGFVAPTDDGFGLTRLVITHCVIDAQTASVPVAATGDVPESGQWVEVTGTVRAASDGTLTLDAAEVTEIDEPEDPYEY
ncbi:TIGR03943 family putative permease subunit [Microbacterium xanthum]|uniref:TIGR03943 family putative permease subunit n=1 Tax=Microbacterium xanthum TaxID=3079794 RepID=UPI002AD5A112|nr:TIGR03943 family protein [Microbacterium sp. KSW-48]MDZ8173031.1 TIGR03943 family protein [Microbacterium sp. KSW-48]